MNARRRTRADPAGDGLARRGGPSLRHPAEGVRVSAAIRLSGWPEDPAVGQLVLTDHTMVPSPSQIADGIGRARDLGYHTLRTSALFPRATDAVLDAGFRPIDTLVLLRSPAGRSPDPTTRHRVRRLPRRRDREAAGVDRLAFGPTWGNDLDGIRAIRSATPWHAARCVTDRGLLGFVIAGAGGHSGYIQRLAVHPDHRRIGIADALVAHVTARLAARGVDEILVNTGITNHAALQLYRRHGFVELRDRLVVAELTLSPQRGRGRDGDHEVVSSP